MDAKPLRHALAAPLACIASTTATAATAATSTWAAETLLERGHFPSDGSASKPVGLALRNIGVGGGNAAQERRTAMNQLAIRHEERFMRSVHGAGRQALKHGYMG